MRPINAAPELETPEVSSNEAVNPNRLEPMLIRLPPTLAEKLRLLARHTRVRQSDYLREAVADLINKYVHVMPQDGQH
jgi:hypothetical protein